MAKDEADSSPQPGPSRRINRGLDHDMEDIASRVSETHIDEPPRKSKEEIIKEAEEIAHAARQAANWKTQELISMAEEIRSFWN
jgi:hypothetical protein